jgi:hypothetical protein
MTRRRSRRAALGALSCAAVLLFMPPAFAQDPTVTQAQSVALSWLALVDAGNAKASWDAAGQKFRDAIDLARWTEGLAALRAPLGAMQTRTLHNAEFEKAVPGMPDGDYALLRFRTIFAGKPDGEESITMERGPDGMWAVVGYVVR